jgi:cytochrome c-type biogenesis protein
MDVNFLLVFLAGLGSFLSPCVLPLVPSYLAFLSGELHGQKTLVPTLGFVFGFSLVFIVLGLTIAGIGGILSAIPGIFALGTLLAGLFLIILGLHLAFGLFPFFYREFRFHPQQSTQPMQIKQVAESSGLSKAEQPEPDDEPAKNTGFRTILRAIGVGAAFGAGWTPCIGPILAAVLTLAATSQDPLLGSLYLGVYSLGLGVPFILASVFIGNYYQLKSQLTKYLGHIQKISGYILIGFGVLIGSGRFQLFTSAIIQSGLWLDVFAQAYPGLAKAIGISIWGVIIVLVTPVLIRRRKKTGTISIFLGGWIGVGSLLLALEAVGRIRLLSLIALWLQFEGF